MYKGWNRKVTALFAALVVLLVGMSSAHAAGKVGYVDLRRAFYEYDEAVERQQEMEELTQSIQEQRNEMVTEITEMRDRAEMLTGDAREEAQAEIDNKLLSLQEFDQEKRQALLAQKNEMFRQVVEDIEEVVTNIGTEESYEYILDSRYIMYAREELDLTDAVLEELNK